MPVLGESKGRLKHLYRAVLMDSLAVTCNSLSLPRKLPQWCLPKSLLNPNLRSSGPFLWMSPPLLVISTASFPSPPSR